MIQRKIQTYSRWFFAVSLVFSVVASAVTESSLTTTSAAKASQDSVSVKSTDEKDILISLDEKQKSASDSSSLFRVILTFGLVGTLATGAYILAKKKSIQQGKSSNPMKIKVLSQHYLGPKKSLAVVRVAGESILIGVTENNINMIKSLALLDEEIPEASPSDFGNIFQSSTKNSDFQENEDEQALMSIKDRVTKTLQNMRNPS
jgi:flagellar protein FliO/FliZ